MNERYKGLIKYQTEILRFLSIIFFADITGVLSLIRNGHFTISERILILVGFIIIFGLSIIAYRLDRKIISRIKKLR